MVEVDSTAGTHNWSCGYVFGGLSLQFIQTIVCSWVFVQRLSDHDETRVCNRELFAESKLFLEDIRLHTIANDHANRRFGFNQAIQGWDTIPCCIDRWQVFGKHSSLRKTSSLFDHFSCNKFTHGCESWVTNLSILHTDDQPPQRIARHSTHETRSYRSWGRHLKVIRFQRA